MKIVSCIITLLVMSIAYSQDDHRPELPYSTIPEPAAEYTAGTVISRMIDGLGFRYYWATQGLTPENLSYKPSADGRTLLETLNHLYGLSTVIYNSAIKKDNNRINPLEIPSSLEELRKETLNNLKKSSEIFLKSQNLGEHPIQFTTKKGTSEFPFWNQINGPIEDAVWHSGQIVLMRRAAGNPIDSKVNVFLGVRRPDN